MANLEHTAAVTRMQTFIEKHLDEEITLHALAQQAGYSPWHCAKMFKEYTDKSPFEYIRKLRLSKAALVLRDEDLRVVDVALDFVFDSHELFVNSSVLLRRHIKRRHRQSRYLPHILWKATI